jgi:hypothetical protein
MLILSALTPTISSDDEKKLSKTQIEFNKLTKKIAKLKAENTLIDEELKRAAVLISEKLLPVDTAYRQACLTYITILDAAFETGKFKKNERETLSQLISSYAWNALTINVPMDKSDIEKIKKLHDKYSPETLSEMNQSMDDSMETMLKDVFGFDFDAEKARTDARYYHEFREKVKEKMDSEEGKQAFYNSEYFTGSKPRKKTKKQLEKEAREKELAELETKDARALYTALAKTLHPDLETDDTRRAEKTEAMKDVTQAYSKNDLFELLQLHLKHISNTDVLSTAVDEQLKRFIGLLKKQIDALQYERVLLFRSPQGEAAGDMLGMNFRFDKKRLDAEFNQHQADLNFLQKEIELAKDYEQLKHSLKDVAKQFRDAERFMEVFGKNF